MKGLLEREELKIYLIMCIPIEVTNVIHLVGQITNTNIQLQASFTLEEVLGSRGHYVGLFKGILQ